ncbi:RHS repeat-associated core domain-containing protein [Salmonella enterica]|nr:RHS repeat-associated core domain-containing protein [Salmonella enterica]
MNETFTSLSGNFISALSTSTDPRTGQFMVNFPLASLNGNNSLGPELTLSLSYSPLVYGNAGFGTGFSLGITQFNNQTNLLELSNGEKYRVEAGTDTVRNKKLNNFRFAYTNGNDDADGYTIFWKEGKQELLTLTGDGTFVTTLITSPLGHTLTLEWDWSGQYPLLNQVSDESSPLCSVEYGFSEVVMTVWPNTDETYTVTFSLINDSQLDTVTRQVTDDETFTWAFLYDAVDGVQQLLLTGVDYPTGMQDRVEYSQIAGLQYPEAAGISERLPAVLSHTRNPGAGQPETIIYYQYTEQNFLGYNGNFGDWAADSDYLYTTLTDYTYGSTETVSDGDVTVSTTRIYNNYHLQVSEETTRQGITSRTDFTYYAEDGYFIDDQPSQFQLVREKLETWTDGSGNSRTEKTETEFDESGNPVRLLSPDGTETVIIWYAPEGDDGCPAEPYGFTRFVRSRTVTPRLTDYDAPVMMTEYTYKTAADSHHIIQDTVTQSADEVVLQKRRYQYNVTAGDAEYGRMTGMTHEIWSDGEGSESFVTTQVFTTVVGDGVMKQTRSVTGHDSLSVTTSRIQSACSGRLVSVTDAQNVTTTFTWDLAGRLLSLTVAPATDYENTTTWSYAVEDGGPVTTKTDASGNQIRTYFDGTGRSIRVQRFDLDDTQEWFDVLEQRYSTLGQLVAGVATDWMTATQDSYVVDVNISYDEWGGISQQTFSDGTQNLQKMDPVALLQRTSMKGSSAAGSLSSGEVTLKFDNSSLLPVTETRTDTSGLVTGERLKEWDGLGRLRTETDELGNQTVRTYDAYGRILTQTQADGSIVTRAYAPHLTGNQVTSISVTGPDTEGKLHTWSLGSQTFDSLGRLLRSISGGRTTTYTYEGACPFPASAVQASGKAVSYTYIPALGNVVSSLTADGVTQTFSYDALTGELLSDQDGNTGNARTWTPSGNLKTETVTLGDDHREAGYSYTLAGEAVTYTDISGKTTQYMHDGFGRVTTLTDDALTVSLEYDALSRLSRQTATDTDMDSSLTTTLKYDDFGREVNRTLTDSSGSTIIVTQGWMKNGLLETRTTVCDGSEIRKETFTYDARNRLTEYSASGSSGPEDAYGHVMSAQTYHFDALSNLHSVTTTLDDGTTDTATYVYGNAADPTQLTSVTHTHSAYPQSITLAYDTDGRMTRDEAGRTLNYDATGRLISVSGEAASGTYGYDALNRLVCQTADGEDTRQLYYRAGELVSEVQQADETRYIRAGHTCFGVDSSGSLTLTGGDQHDSLLWSREAGKAEGEQHVWSPYGCGKDTGQLPGFNGERRDPVSGAYHLGNGYRAYNPVLMRFNCPDSLSPFGAGGINPYTYCEGDPVNHTDPSGHLSWQAITGIVVGSIGLALSVFTAGASLAAAGGVMAALGTASATSLATGTLAIVADVTAIASGAVEESDPEASSVLGWVSMATGLAGLGVSAGRGASKMLGSSRGSYNLNEEMTELSTTVFGRDINITHQGRNVFKNYSGFTDNFRGTGEDAIVTHGNKNGELMINFFDQVTERNGFYELVPDTSAEYISPTNFVNQLKTEYRIDLTAKNTMLNLVSCYGKRTAQELANITNRPVRAYSKRKAFTSVLADNKMAALEKPTFIVNTELNKYDPRKLFGKQHRPSKPRVFYPKGIYLPVRLESEI